jgi:hypothetical protein
MAFVLHGGQKALEALVGKLKVRGGQCVGLVQYFVSRLGNTKTWKQGARVVELRSLEPGTVIANFNALGKWPGLEHNNHACLFLGFGPRSQTTGFAMSINVVEQFVQTATIQARRLPAKGWGPNGTYLDRPNNADAFWVVE